MTWVCELSEFRQFVDTAMPGSQFPYMIVGHAHVTILSGMMAKHAWEWAVAGKIYLVQKRIHKLAGQFEYIAVKASPKPIKKLMPLSEKEFNKLLDARPVNYIKHVRRVPNVQTNS
jgi:hypothetical protein